MPVVGDNQERTAEDVKRGEIMNDNIEFTEHYFSNYLAAKTILSSAEKYSNLVQQKIPQEKVNAVRNEFIRELKWDWLQFKKEINKKTYKTFLKKNWMKKIETKI